MLKLIFFASFIFISFSIVAVEVNYQNKLLTIENNHIKQSISFADKQIKIVSRYDKLVQQELLVNANQPAYFEFVLNKKLITSNDKNWLYKQHQSRKMVNGGTEIQVQIQHTALKNLTVILFYQFFPNSGLIREKMHLVNTGKSPLFLHHLHNKIHFIYPAYQYQLQADSIKETRIASFGEELLSNYNESLAPNDRHYDNGEFFNLAHCHMFHPQIIRYQLSSQPLACKGPFNTTYFNNGVLLSAYEHASQDSRRGFSDGKSRVGISTSSQHTNINAGVGFDQQQGVDAISGLIETDDDFRFIEFVNQKQNTFFTLKTCIIKGGYLNGETIKAGQFYETVWHANVFFTNAAQESELLLHYLREQITEHPASRKIHFYYNTWGMQRDANNKTGLREIFTEKRMLEEINYAAQMGVDLFVLDDGWEETMGNWKPHQKRLPNGLKPLIEEMKKNNITPGIWLSPMGVDSNLAIYKNNRHWVIRDVNNNPIKAQWGYPAFDFVSDFYSVFVNDCKALIDSGILFFKWDAINTFNSTLPNLHHGNTNYSREEIRDRYAYLLPFYVTRAMRELREYNPEVIVEIDITEPERSIIGLMPLQEGKLFWMNNGASGYNDFSHYRAKSMRTIINRYAKLIPNELITYANYPHNLYPFFAQRYTVNSSLIGGYGFWGDLSKLNLEQRLRVKNSVELTQKVLPLIMAQPVQLIGNVGSSPEIYAQINAEKASGQVIAFSGSAIKYNYTTSINPNAFLCVLNHAFSMNEEGLLTIPFQFTMPNDTREAFILSNTTLDLKIISSTCWLKDAYFNEDKTQLNLLPGSHGALKIKVKNKLIEVEAITDEKIILNLE
jgi:hypothetical protein